MKYIDPRDFYRQPLSVQVKRWLRYVFWGAFGNDSPSNLLSESAKNDWREVMNKSINDAMVYGVGIWITTPPE